MVGKNGEICKCMCHRKGYGIMHIMPCCQYTYEKYINEDGSIDMEAYEKIVEKYKKKEK